MKSISLCRHVLSLCVILILSGGSLAQHLILPANVDTRQMNQTATAPAVEPQALSSPKAEPLKPVVGAAAPQTASEAHHKNIFTHLLREQETLWASPFRMKPGDAKWVVPLALTAAVLFATDNRAMNKVPKGEGTLDVSSKISRLGEGYSTFAFAGLAYTLGKFTRNERLRDTGKVGIEALINTSIAVGGLKYALGRKRPAAALEERGDFFSGGQAFPSGHSATCWALAAVVAEEYDDKPLVRFASYALASAVSVSRFTGQKHFPSDVFVGSAIGYLIGRYTVKAHGTKRKTNLIPAVSPTISQATKTYGLSASLSF